MSAIPLGILCRICLLLLFPVMLSACATARAPLTAVIPGRQVETLQSAIDITVQAGDHSFGGRAFLIFKQPDRFHMAILSPFGLTVLELFSDRDRVTCLLPSRQTAYAGSLSELPENSALKSMALMTWVVAPPPGYGPAFANRELTTAAGDRCYFDNNGLVARKVSRQGDEAVYQEYRNLDGVAFPSAIVISNRHGATVRVVFDEPQLNLPVEDSALVPNLEGVSVLPLSQFRGM